MSRRTSAWLYTLAGAYEDERWALASGHAWARLDTIVREYVSGDRTRISARQLVINTRTDVYARHAGLEFREQRVGSTIASTIFCPSCRTNGHTLEHVPGSPSCDDMRRERDWSIGRDE